MRHPFILSSLLLACGGAPSGTSALRLLATSPTAVSARGGVALSLRGTGFNGTPTVTLDGTPVTATRVSSTEVTVVTPPLFAGRAAVVLSFDGQKPVELRGGLEVRALELRFTEAPGYALIMPAQPTITGAALADLDGDQHLDVLTCSDRCLVSVNDGLANFDTPKGSAAGLATDAGLVTDAGTTEARAVATGPFPRLWPFAAVGLVEDLDGDGDPDVVFTGGDAGALYRNTSGRFEPTPLPAGISAPMAAGDLDLDGTLELISAGSGRLQVTSAASLARASRSPDAGGPLVDGARALVLADVDQDKDLDVVVATGGAEPALRLFFNTRGALTEATGGVPGATAQPVSALAAGDVDGDGAVDLVLVGPGQDRLLINDGSGHFFDATAASLPVDASPGASVQLVDLDRDRDLDLLVGNQGATPRLYLNDGRGRFVDRTPLLPVRAETAVSFLAGDLDEDHDLDLVLVTADGQRTRLFLSVEPTP